MRRFLFLLLLALLLTFAWRRTHGPDGAGTRHAPEKYTPAGAPAINPKDVQVLAALDGEYTRLVEAVVPSVVSITSSKRVRVNAQAMNPWELFFSPRQRAVDRVATSLGSGVIVSKEGHILTNHHVIAGMEEISVQLTDGRVLPAQLIGSHEETDIAVLRIDSKGIQPLPLGDSDNVRVGQMVFAVGNPFGLQETVTQGIISAKGRRAMSDSGVEFLQTDAAVNQGNSGGPLLNLHGEIIGINSAIYSKTGGWLGISFAIPANVARRTLESILKTGRVVRGYLGVSMMDLTPELARRFGVSDAQGALVAEIVPGSPAEKAGLRPGDVIRSFNGRAVQDSAALRRRVTGEELGAKVELGVAREGKEITLTMAIAEMPSDLTATPPALPLAPQPGSPSPPPPAAKVENNVLTGVTVGEIPAAVRDMLPEDVRGVIVAQLQPDAPAAEKLRVGDVIEEVNQTPVPTGREFERIAAALRPGERALLYVCRGRTRSFVVVTP